MKALIFAAGVGSRLKPFTDSHPKALVEVAGKPMLRRVIERLRDDAGVREMVVNVHHFPGQIRDFLARNNDFGVKIRISDETDSLLDTGGGLLRAVPLLDLQEREPVILYNADILTDFPLPEFIRYHIESGNDATLFVSRRESSRMLYFNAAMELAGWKNLRTGQTRPEGFDAGHEGLAARAFGGVHIVQATLFPVLRKYASARSEVFSIMPFYLDSITELKICGWSPSSADAFRWFDVGSPEKLEMARRGWNGKV